MATDSERIYPVQTNIATNEALAAQEASSPAGNYFMGDIVNLMAGFARDCEDSYRTLCEEIFDRGVIANPTNFFRLENTGGFSSLWARGDEVRMPSAEAKKTVHIVTNQANYVPGEPDELVITDYRVFLESTAISCARSRLKRSSAGHTANWVMGIASGPVITTNGQKPNISAGKEYKGPALVPGEFEQSDLPLMRELAEQLKICGKASRVH